MAKRRSFPETQKLNPWRRPEWRWNRACSLVAEGRYASAKRDDQPTCRAVRFVRRIKRYVSQRGFRAITKEEPDLVMALRLYQDGGLRQLELHARILAKQSSRAIARSMGLTTPIVETYRTLFFGIDGRIHATHYITYVVAGMPPVGPPSIETLLLLSAFHHGPVVIPAWMDYLSHADKTHDLATEVGRRREAIAIFVAAHQLPNDESTRWKLLKTAPLIFDDRWKFRPSRPVNLIIRRNTDRILRSLPWASTDSPCKAASSVPDVMPPDRQLEKVA
jgi:hypothetical protein